MNISRWLTHSVTLKRYKGKTGAGEKKYEESNIKCRIEKKMKTTRIEAGEIILGSGTIYSIEEIKSGDIIEYQGETLEILSVSEYRGRSGNLEHFEGVFR